MPSLYSNILTKIIESHLNITVYTENTFCTLDNPTETYFGISTEICPEIHNWKQVFQSSSTLTMDESISFILLFYYLSVLNKPSSVLQNHIIMNGKPATIYSQNSKKKFEIVRQLYTNAFCDDQTRGRILSIIQKAQRAYYGFARLARVYRLKRIPVQINTDLYMSELDPQKKTTFVLLTRDKQYYFSLNDLAKIMMDSLTYSYLLFSEPKVCKNPYNNVPFSKSTLYNIYFQMKSVFCVVPRIIQLYFETGFNIFVLKKQNEPYLRELIVREYVAKTEPAKLRGDILKMIREYDPNQMLSIHPSFPAEALVKGLKHIYIVYLSHKHTTDDQTYEYYEHEIKYKMTEFIRINPNFGKVTKPPRFVSKRTGIEPFSNITNTLALWNLLKTEYIESAVHTPTNVVLDFLDSHQYSEPAYNRFIYTGSTLSLDNNGGTVPPLPMQNTSFATLAPNLYTVENQEEDTHDIDDDTTINTVPQDYIIEGESEHDADDDDFSETEWEN
jgi:hypothetical protein